MLLADQGLAAFPSFLSGVALMIAAAVGWKRWADLSQLSEEGYVAYIEIMLAALFLLGLAGAIRGVTLWI